MPGLIDMHCHIYPVFPYPREDSLRTISAEEHMTRCGVTTAVDAGTCGWRNFGDFKEQVIDRTKLRILAFLDIAAKGMAYTDSEQAVADINPRIAAAVAQEWQSCIVGIKSAHYWPRHPDAAHPAFASIDGAREAAALSGTRVMVDSIPVVPVPSSFPCWTKRERCRISCGRSGSGASALTWGTARAASGSARRYPALNRTSGRTPFPRTCTIKM